MLGALLAVNQPNPLQVQWLLKLFLHVSTYVYTNTTLRT